MGFSIKDEGDNLHMSNVESVVTLNSPFRCLLFCFHIACNPILLCLADGFKAFVAGET